MFTEIIEEYAQVDTLVTLMNYYHKEYQMLQFDDSYIITEADDDSNKGKKKTGLIRKLINGIKAIIKAIGKFITRIINRITNRKNEAAIEYVDHLSSDELKRAADVIDDELKKADQKSPKEEHINEAALADYSFKASRDKQFEKNIDQYDEEIKANVDGQLGNAIVLVSGVFLPVIHTLSTGKVLDESVYCAYNVMTAIWFISELLKILAASVRKHQIYANIPFVYKIDEAIDAASSEIDFCINVIRNINDVRLNQPDKLNKQITQYNKKYQPTYHQMQYYFDTDVKKSKVYKGYYLKEGNKTKSIRFSKKDIQIANECFTFVKHTHISSKLKFEEFNKKLKAVQDFVDKDIKDVNLYEDYNFLFDELTSTITESLQAMKLIDIFTKIGTDTASLIKVVVEATKHPNVGKKK